MLPEPLFLNIHMYGIMILEYYVGITVVNLLV